MKKLLVITILSLASSSALAAPGEIAKLLPSDGEIGEFFSSDIAVHGNTAVIGANQAGIGEGAAYVFVRTGTSWAQQAELTVSDLVVASIFGWAVAVHGDTILVGASGDDELAERAGAVYVFERSAGVWTQSAKLLASDGDEQDGFGNSLAMDADTAIIGAAGVEHNAGAVYVFELIGGVWTEQAKLTASDAGIGHSFGGDVALDGDTFVTASIGNDLAGDDAGSAYVFVNSAGTWTQQAQLVASDAAVGQIFGISVSVDGDTAAFGAPLQGRSSLPTGAAHVYTRTGTVWTEQAKLTASDPVRGGFAFDISLEGDTLLIGSNGSLNDCGEKFGAAYLFNRSGSTWTENAKLTKSEAGFGRFGQSVAMSGDNVLVGDGWHNRTGAVFAYSRADAGPVAMCRDATVSAGATCSASTSIDDGSFDPDGASIGLVQSPPGPYLLGPNDVSLTVTDTDVNASTRCCAVVTVTDDTPPDPGCPADTTVPATSPSGELVAFTPVAVDNCAVSSESCMPTSGSTFSIGTTPVTCNATDTSGNSDSCMFDVRVTGAIEQLDALISLVESLGLSRGITNSLVRKLLDAQRHVSRGTIRGACGKLSDFLAEVAAQTGEALTLAQAALLTEEASRIRTLLGC